MECFRIFQLTVLVHSQPHFVAAAEAVLSEKALIEPTVQYQRATKCQTDMGSDYHLAA